MVFRETDVFLEYVSIIQGDPSYILQYSLNLSALSRKTWNNSIEFIRLDKLYSKLQKKKSIVSQT